MKRIEVVMNSSALDWTLSRRRPRGWAFPNTTFPTCCSHRALLLKNADAGIEGRITFRSLSSGVKVEFVTFDEDARKIAERIFTLVVPERISIFPLDKIIGVSPDPVRPVRRRSVIPAPSKQ